MYDELKEVFLWPRKAVSLRNIAQNLKSVSPKHIFLESLEEWCRSRNIFGIKSDCQVREWTTRYRQEGAESLSEDRRKDGNNPMLGKYQRDPNIENWPLEKQIEYLKMENAILKKVKALRLKNSGERNDT